MLIDLYRNADGYESYYIGTVEATLGTMPWSWDNSGKIIGSLAEVVQQLWNEFQQTGQDCDSLFLGLLIQRQPELFRADVSVESRFGNDLKDDAPFRIQAYAVVNDE
jgi:hypothetical protein